jgi:molybdate transport system ATP-binding protein
MKISHFSCDLQRKIKKAISCFWQERFISLKTDCPTAKDFLLKNPFLLPKTNPALLEKALELAGISEQTLEQELMTLSNGELRRLMLARNYMEEPDLWILDDPFGGMDPEYRKFLAERIELFKQTGINIKINLARDEEIIENGQCKMRRSCF